MKRKDRLRAGDMVEVLPIEEIKKTLDERDRTEGVMFMPAMKQYCGTRKRVMQRVKYVFDEEIWKMKKIRDVVILDGVICKGEDTEDGCDRSCLFFWKEAWLRRV
ncbi:MAG: hypothetical protein JSW71_13770 [Gemmatimonadota bacterium]|nr:MAG: hypothetical protein JSW71_13770 [Gemmatimonadota bacterium]